MHRRELGVTVLPEFFQVEGVEQVLDNLARRAKVTAIATSPYVMRPVADGDGSREPPIDAGAGSVRILDRPLWGRRDLWVRTAPSFVPDLAFYDGLRYRPAEPDELTRREGARVGEAIRAAKSRGLALHLQIRAAIPQAGVNSAAPSKRTVRACRTGLRPSCALTTMDRWQVLTSSPMSGL